MTNRPDVCGGHLLPKPIPRDPEKALEDVPEQFQNETYFWGPLDHKSAEKVLNGLPAGSFLIRQSSSPAPAAFYTLSVRFNGLTKHFKLFYSTDSGEFSLGKQLKRFPTVDGLVEDGLLNYHLEQVFRREKEQQEQRQEKEQKAIEDNNKNLLLIKKESVAEHRKHDFKANTFRGLNWCEVCAQFLWGFPVQGVKCENCSFVAHKKCSESVANKECFPPNGDKAGAIKGPHFRVELAVVSKQTNSIPFIVTKCVEEVEARGIMQEGIYRVSGFADEVDELKAAFEKCGPQTNISTETLNIHTVAGVLKMFFRQLPTPLISAEVTQTLLKQLNLQHNDLVDVVRTNLLKLPAAHWSCLKYMTNHLKKVSKYHETNKMNETNLATVFAPTLIGTDLNQFTDLAQEIHLLTLIIRECDQLFTS